MSKKLVVNKLVIFICMFVLILTIANAEEQYDPQYTLQALNLAIASIQKISSSKDRVILTQEYDNIINNLNLERIKPDDAMRNIFDSIMDFITKKN